MPINLDKITIVRWPKFPGENAQLSAYRHFLHTYRDWVEWAAIIDLDEFINLKEDRTITRFIDRFPGASAIAINWRIFGSSGQKSYRQLPMLDRFLHASQITFEPNILVKTIHRLSQTTTIHVHYGEYVDGAIVMSTDGTQIAACDRIQQIENNYAIAQINHYFVKSKEEWAAKLRRGYPDGTIRQPNMFFEYDRNEVFDDSILRHRPEFRRWIKKIRQPNRQKKHFYTFIKRLCKIKILEKYAGN